VERPDTEPIHSIPEARRITRARVKDLGALVLKYGKRYIPPSREEELERARPGPTQAPVTSRTLWILRIVPPVLLALFFGSFVWDFEEVSLSLMGRVLELEGVMRIVSVSGMIGFLTNWIAITMLFRPRERRPLLGQGLIPAQRDRVIHRLAQAVSEELINEQIIKDKIQESGVISRYRERAVSVVRGVIEDPEFRIDVKQLVVDYTSRVLGSPEIRIRLAEIAADKLEDHAGRGVSGLALRIYRFFREDEFQERIDAAIGDLPQTLDRLLDETDHLLDLVPEKFENRADDIERWATTAILNFVGQMDIHGMILDNMRRYDERQLEELIKNSSNEQLNYIKYLGGVLGFFGGFVIWEPLPALVFFGAVGGLVLLLDLVLAQIPR
jgi:uncharacterized membrane-anchored protein YjiN (DUF445 family)